MKSVEVAENEEEKEADPFVGIEAKTAPFGGASLGAWSGGRFRVLGPENQAACYHVMSRTSGGDVWFDEVEKEALRRLLWKMSEFLGVRILTYCVMGNHFHALVEVPCREEWLSRFREGEKDEAKLMRHLESFYSKAYVKMLRAELDRLRKARRNEEAEELLGRFLNRFCDLSRWMKEIKERFSRWYNKRHGRRGTLWMDRFKSVLVEEGDALETMACYIDLNPVRAGLVEDPKDYRWCGYAEAVAGSRRARRGLCKVLGCGVEHWQDRGAAAYHGWLVDEGREIRDKQGLVIRKGFDPDRARAELEEGRQLGRGELIRLRVRYFTSGLVLGGREFVESAFERYRDCFGSKRKNGARLIREARNSELTTLRALRVNAVG